LMTNSTTVAGRSVAAKRHFHGSRKETSFCSMEALVLELSGICD